MLNYRLRGWLDHILNHFKGETFKIQNLKFKIILYRL